MQSYLIGIPFVNRTDLLTRAIASVPRNLRDMLIVLDNSPRRTVVADPAWRCYCPAVPLSYTQSMNFFRGRALALVVRCLLVMHNDAAAAPGVFDRLLELAVEKTERGDRWGVLLTNYDALAVFNTQMLADVGEWDTVFSQYFSDNDYYRRVRLTGWTVEETGLEVEHTPSQTINSDPRLRLLNAATFDLYREYYRRKWGGYPGHETHVRPFNVPG